MAELDARAIVIANEIVEKLFINGTGQKAQRLVLELENGKGGGGWSKGPVRDVIATYITKAIKKGRLK